MKRALCLNKVVCIKLLFEGLRVSDHRSSESQRLKGQIVGMRETGSKKMGNKKFEDRPEKKILYPTFFADLKSHFITTMSNKLYEKNFLTCKTRFTCKLLACVSRRISGCRFCPTKAAKPDALAGLQVA